MATETTAGRLAEPVKSSAFSADQVSTLCQRALDGEARSEAALISLIMPRIRDLLRRLVWDKDSVDDLLQDTLELAVRKLRAGAIQHPELFLAFVCGIARNVVIAYIRKKQRDAGNLSIDEVVEHHHLATEGCVDPLQQLLGDESSRLMLSRIAKLPRPRDRRVLIGSYFEGLSARRLARELKLKEAHFYRVLYRAKKRLEKLLLADPLD